MSALRQRDNPLLINQIHKDKSFKWLSGYAHQLLAVLFMAERRGRCDEPPE
jgi:hypothetical protein